MTPLQRIIANNRAGIAVALPSICSAHPDVLRAVMCLPEAAGRPLLIEATSNQVNQDGGYTGMTPASFLTYVHNIADELGCARDRLVFGGDHLGPQAWKTLPAEIAMSKAKDMVADYVAAGFTKIHLDCSEGCAGEPAHLDDELVAQRAAALAQVCEDAATDPSQLCYIVGTEVPVPGGARKGHSAVEPTRAEAVGKTIAAHLDAFPPAAAARIVGLVVQPGVEFSATTIDYLPNDDTTGLRAALEGYPNLTYEAHSTDYQHHDAYPRLANMGFAIHKVGPALTFAYRQAVYALDHIRASLLNTDTKLSAVMETEMLNAPANWDGHFSGDAQTLRVLRHYSYADRIRYYWPREAPQKTLAQLHRDLADQSIPRPLALQFVPPEVITRAETLSEAIPLSQRIVLASIHTALAPYYFEGEAA